MSCPRLPVRARTSASPRVPVCACMHACSAGLHSCFLPACPPAHPRACSPALMPPACVPFPPVLVRVCVRACVRACCAGLCASVCLPACVRCPLDLPVCLRACLRASPACLCAVALEGRWHARARARARPRVGDVDAEGGWCLPDADISKPLTTACIAMNKKQYDMGPHGPASAKPGLAPPLHGPDWDFKADLERAYHTS